MTRLVVGNDRNHSTLFPDRLEDYLSEDNPVPAIDVFVTSAFGGTADIEHRLLEARF